MKSKFWHVNGHVLNLEKLSGVFIESGEIRSNWGFRQLGRYYKIVAKEWVGGGLGFRHYSLVDKRFESFTEAEIALDALMEAFPSECLVNPSHNP